MKLQKDGIPIFLSYWYAERTRIMGGRSAL